jgi:putative peptidoglycan lipid II flippase
MLTYTVVMVGFPALVALAGAADRRPFADAVTRAVRLVLVLVLPVVVALMVTAHDVVEVLFERGAFTAQDTSATADVLRLYVLGVPGQTLAALLVLAFFAVPRTLALPGRVALLGLLLLVAVDVPLARALGAPGLALGNALAITTMAVGLLVLLARRVAPLPFPALLQHLTRCVLAAAVAGGCGLAVREVLVQASLPPLVTGGLSGLLLLAVYAAVAAALGVAEVRAAVGARGR